MKRTLRIVGILLLVALIAVPVCAALFGDNFTPSITQKGAPRMMGFRNPKDGIVYPAVVLDENGEILDYVEEDGIQIIPLADADEEGTPDHAAFMLNWGYESLTEAALGEAIEGLDAVLEEREVGKTSEEMVVYELFHITLSDKYVQYLKDGRKLAVKLEQQNSDIDFEMVIHATDKEFEWVQNEEKTESFTWMVEGEDSLIYEDGERILVFDQTCLFGLMTDKKD